MPHDFDSLKVVGQGLKELSKKENSGFKEYPAFKEIFKPLKELVNGTSFQELSSLKIGFEPLKPKAPHGPGKKDEGKGSEGGKSDNASNTANENQAANTEAANSEEKKEDKKAEKKDDKKPDKK